MVDGALSLAYAWHMPRSRMVPSKGKPVRLFRNGRNQAVRIPREFELAGDIAIIHKEGERLIIEPAPRRSLLAVLATLAPLREDFPEIKELPNDSIEL